MKKNSISYYGKYRELSPGSIIPGGFFHEFLKRQKDGLTGNFKEQGYPFDTEMWKGISKIRFREHEYGGRERPLPIGTAPWWPYEQCSYMLDGLVRLGIVLKDETRLNIFREQMEAFFEHRSENGRLGLKNYNNESEWPFAVFFRAIHAYIEAFGDPADLKEKLREHYNAVPEKELYPARHMTNIEGLLKVAEWLDDPELIEKALSVYNGADQLLSAQNATDGLPYSRLKTDKCFSLHGVTLSEELKLPVLLFLYTGNQEFLEVAENALNIILSNHEQIPGLPSCIEFAMGKDPLQGYETCVTTDFTWMLGYFLMAAGKAEYGDRIEKIIFNALPGAITKDFSLLQYLSSPNQLAATPFSNHTHFLRSMATFRQFRHNHFPECCPGNVHRAMPNYVLRMWMQEEDGSPVASLYGACTASFTCQGKKVGIEEITEYPFGEEIRFVIHPENEMTFPITLRIPGWCRNAELTADGKKIAVQPGTMVRIEQMWHEGREILLKLPMETVVKTDRNWKWCERGPLVYSLPVKANMERERDSRFSPVSLLPAEEWNFALDDSFEIEECRKETSQDAFPFEQPNLTLKVKTRKITGYDTLELARYTPQVPLFYSVKEKIEEKELVPYGATLLRVTAFPDTTERKVIPVSSVKVVGPFPYNHKIGMAEQKFQPETMGDFELWDSTFNYVQEASGCYYDLISFFLKKEYIMAYMMFRFYSPEDQDAVLAVRFSDGAQAWLNEEPLFIVEPCRSGEFTAPYHYKVRLKKGANFLRMKVVDCQTPGQHRISWGAGLEVFTV